MDVSQFGSSIFSLLEPLVVGQVTSFLGLSVIVVRFWPILIASVRGNWQREVREIESHFPLVSIVIPARNEEKNILTLLKSLAKVQWPNLEIIVVDDESKDRTSELVLDFSRMHTNIHTRLIAGQPRPEGWTGKNWACHQGFAVASGEWILFTDADTSHEPQSLRIAMSEMQSKGLDLLSAAPYHRCETFWEKLMGPFHLFLLLSTAAFSVPRPNRVFAIGQYLLFRRQSYLKQGGHEKVKLELCDDLELARLCLEAGGRYAVEGRMRLFQVRMYDRFWEFIKGWRRIFRLGFRHAKITSSLEIYFVIAALTAGLQFFGADIISIMLMGVSLGFIASLQPRFGNFSMMGVLLLPLSLTLFVCVSLLAIYDLALKRSYVWRGLSYQGTAG